MFVSISFLAMIQILLYLRKSWTTNCVGQYLSSCGKFCLCLCKEL